MNGRQDWQKRQPKLSNKNSITQWQNGRRRTAAELNNHYWMLISAWLPQSLGSEAYKVHYWLNICACSNINMFDCKLVKDYCRIARHDGERRKLIGLLNTTIKVICMWNVSVGHTSGCEIKKWRIDWRDSWQVMWLRDSHSDKSCDWGISNLSVFAGSNLKLLLLIVNIYLSATFISFCVSFWNQPN